MKFEMFDQYDVDHSALFISCDQEGSQWAALYWAMYKEQLCRCLRQWKSHEFLKHLNSAHAARQGELKWSGIRLWCGKGGSDGNNNGTGYWGG